MVMAHRRIQIGQESTRGTAVAADLILLGRLTMTPTISWSMPEDEERNSLALLHRQNNVGQQGAFSFEGTDYLLEAKWRKDLMTAKDLDSLAGPLSRRLDNTLGLYLSINGFSPDAVKTHSSGRRLIILMDGSDLMAVLEGRIDLIELLLRKRRAAAQTGNIYLMIHEIL